MNQPRISVRPSRAAVLLALLAAACAPPERTEEVRLGLLGGEPAYPLGKPDFTLPDTDGRPFDFRAETDGRLTLLFFGYTSCPDICPIHMATLAGALDELGPELARQVTVVFVSVDPARDTPDRIRRWLDGFDTTFIGLRGSEEEIAEILAQYNYPPPEREGEAGSYLVSHPATIYAFTPDNLGRGMFGSGTSKATWVHDLRRMLEYPWDAVAGPAEPGGIQVLYPFIPAPAAAEGPAAFYLRLVNEGPEADTLLGLDTEAAERGSIHDMRMANGVMRMVLLTFLALPPGDTVVLAPGGRHGMLEGLPEPLTEGDTVVVTLRFAGAGPVAVEVPVVSYTRVVR